MFGFSQRKCPWPAVLHRKSSEMHVMPKEVLFWEYLVISSKLLPNSGTAYNFYVNSAHCLSHAMFLSLPKMCHPLRKQRLWLYKTGSHLKLLEGKVTLFNGVGLFRWENQETQSLEAWVTPLLIVWPRVSILWAWASCLVKWGSKSRLLFNNYLLGNRFVSGVSIRLPQPNQHHFISDFQGPLQS